ncbi:hypothetical protein DESUT3_28150 [Desulfuromonas versatilis]|uniref:PatA-like N-terminal domain-containing protein n=1 Tax=Desulfuromonas versatilis TaxID=2802975 RepID=A0ABN6E035_9BACT|nr:hypothetical protein DESUT3_28150 [Desulfuromonas versatilis]
MLITVLFSLALPAHARVTFGVVPAANSLIRSESQAVGFAAELERRLGEEVRIRLFADEATLHNWLNRFREVDLAVLSRGYIQRQPAGEFFALAENLRSEMAGAEPADPIVARQGLSPQVMRKLQLALYALASDPAARGLIGAPKAPPPPQPAATPPVVTRKPATQAPTPPPVKKAQAPPARSPQAQAPIAAPAPPAVAPPAPEPAPETPPMAVAQEAPESAAPQAPEKQPALEAKPEPMANPGDAGAPQPRIWSDADPAAARAPDSPAPARPEAAGGEGRPTLEDYSRSAGGQAPTADDTDGATTWFQSDLPLVPLISLLVLSLAGALIFATRYRQRQTRDAFAWHSTPPSPAGAAKPRSSTSGAPSPAGAAAPQLKKTRAQATPGKPVPASQPAAPAAVRPKPAPPAVSVEVSGSTAPPNTPRPHHPEAPLREPGDQAQPVPASPPVAKVESPGATAPPVPPLEKPAQPPAAPAAEAGEKPFPFASTEDLVDPEFTPLGPNSEVLNRYRNPFEDDEFQEQPEQEMPAAPTGEADQAEAVALEETPAVGEEAQEAGPEAVPGEPEEVPLQTDASQETFSLLGVEQNQACAGPGISLAEVDEEEWAEVPLEETAPTPAIEVAANEEPIILESQGQEFSYQDAGEPVVEVAEGHGHGEAVEAAGEEPAAVETPAPLENLAAAQTPSSPLNLEGNVAAIRMPALLQLVASQSLPGTLVITTRHDEKRLHFRNGRIALAASVNRANRNQTGFLMNKVGYLLIRQGKITEEQRDKALELCGKDPSKRIGEMLLEMGALNRQSLLEALRSQAESVIFSLFIFPEGHFRFGYEEYPLRPEDDLALDIGDLLENARRNEAEWDNIREAIPSLDTVLDYTPAGRDKLGNARMTVHQKLVLSLIDGRRPINEICVAATMVDLEVYKFLYFMVHAKILHRVNRR